MDQNEVNQNEVNSINSDLIRGHIDTIILKALQAGDRYGYDIIKEIEHKSDGQYIIKQPTLYSCLKRLEVQGFVKSYWGSKSIGGRKKYFTLTDMGRELFMRNKTDWDYSRTVIDKLISDDDYSATYDDERPENVDIVESSDAEINDQDELAAETENNEFIEANKDENKPINQSLQENNLIDDHEIQEVVLYESYGSEESKADINNALKDSNQELNTSICEDEPTEENAENETDLPISYAEQEQNTEEDTDNDGEDLLYKIYEEEDRESYITNVGNAKYEPPKDEEIDSENYFDDIIDNNEYQDEEIAAASTEKVGQDAIILPPDTNAPPIETREFRRVVNENPANTKTVFYSYKHVVPEMDERSAIIDKEYRGIISAMIADNVIITKTTPPQPIRNYQQKVQRRSQETETQDLSNKIASDTGDRVSIRTYNNKIVKEFNNKHYYYSNQLRLLQCGILFGIMLLEIILCFFFIEVQHNQLHVSTASLILYIVATIATAMIPVVAFFLASTNYYKRKRINYSAKSSAVFSIIAFILLSLIVIFINIYAGLLIGNINNYLSTLIMPIILASNVMVNAIIFHFLYTSGKYNIEE